jgi:hypothetical protein
MEPTEYPMAKTTVTRHELCELLLKEIRDVSGLEGVSALEVQPLADGERENGANWSLGKYDPGLADVDTVESALAHIGHYMQRQYSIEEEQFSGL